MSGKINITFNNKKREVNSLVITKPGNIPLEITPKTEAPTTQEPAKVEISPVPMTTQVRQPATQKVEAKPAIKIEKRKVASVNRTNSGHTFAEKAQEYQKEKEHKRTPTIEKSKKDPVLLKRAIKYTMETIKNIIKTCENKKLTNKSPAYENLVNMHAQFVRFNIKKPRNKLQVTKKQTKTETEEQKSFIVMNLNKLTMNVFMKTLDAISTHQNFLTELFIEQLADALFTNSLTGKIFENLYSLFAKSIKETLNESDTKYLSDLFINSLVQKIESKFNEPVVENKVEEFSNTASFFGCLVMRDVCKYDKLFQFAVNFIKQGTPQSIEACLSLILPPAGQLEINIKTANIEIYGKLKEFSNDKEIPSRIRFQIKDVLDLRSSHWADIDNYIPQINTIENIEKRQENKKNAIMQAKQQLQAKKAAAPIIRAAQNQFAALANSEDEEEELAEFDADKMIELYYYEEALCREWDPSQAHQLFIALVQKPEKRAAKVVPVISYVNEPQINQFDAEIAFNACKDVAQTIKGDEYQDLKEAPSRILGYIFARVAANETSYIDKFNDVFTYYDINAIAGFLSEMLRMKKIDLITQSLFWTEYQWRPENVSQIDIVNALSVKDDIIKEFPLYDAILQIKYDMDDMTDTDDSCEEAKITVDDIIDDIQNTQPDILKQKEFGIGVIEYLIYKNEPALNRIATLFLSQQKEIMESLEHIYYSQNIPADSVAPYFVTLRQNKFNTNEFFSAAITSEDENFVAFHNDIGKLIVQN